ncbi:MAG: glycosyltransferase, partial [Candidatus Parvarchaeum sp.]
MNKLYIYGTILNNAEWVADSIASLERLKPERIMITDAGSTDGTKEILQNLAKKYGNIAVEEYYKCKRGKGRQEALNNIYNVAEDSDLVMSVDFDNVYSDFMVNYIKEKSNKVKDMEAYNFGLMTIKTSKLAEWKDLNYGE